ncbi:hypothetical protein JQX13_16975 [Archangium violaceum]|uniref:hypothetical protein n=1 Tax=Archangium violaceum TaxID=83451 RepID=UPI00193C693D|nr:hypothetical protein [Archangium violaceum]QRK11610.1 hypothetical protein JQX13_16975 [Archangium violaceum]
MSVLLVAVACACPGGARSGPNAVADQPPSKSEVPAAAVPPAPSPKRVAQQETRPEVAPEAQEDGAQLEARFEAAEKTLALRPGDAAAQDAFERAWLARELHLLREEVKDHERDEPFLELDGCAAASARECIGSRIGRRFDSSWYRVETSGDAFLLILFHARLHYDNDTKTGNELVVFRGRLEANKDAPLRLDLVSRSEAKVSDAVGAALGRRAAFPDPKGADTRWGVRFEPLSPEEFALMDSLPDEWVGLIFKNGKYQRLTEAPGDRARFFIIKEPKLRMAYLSRSERDGAFEAFQEVSKEGDTYRLGGYRLHWKSNASDVGFLTAETEEGEGEPYVPAKRANAYKVAEPERASVSGDEAKGAPEVVRRLVAQCSGSRRTEELRPGLYNVRCGCGSPCGYSTFVDVNSGRTSPTFWLPLAIDAERQRVALSTRGQQPIRIVGMFDAKEWMLIRRPLEPTGELSNLMEASFSDGQLDLSYTDRRGNAVRETVEVPLR